MESYSMELSLAFMNLQNINYHPELNSNNFNHRKDSSQKNGNALDLELNIFVIDFKGNSHFMASIES
jgi:hypothetical protein